MATLPSTDISLGGIRDHHGNTGECKLSEYVQNFDNYCQHHVIPSSGAIAFTDTNFSDIGWEKSSTAALISLSNSATGTLTLYDTSDVAITTGVTNNGCSAGGTITVDITTWAAQVPNVGDVYQIGYLAVSDLTGTKPVYISNNGANSVIEPPPKKPYAVIKAPSTVLCGNEGTLEASGAYFEMPDYTVNSQYLYPSLIKNGQSITVKMTVDSAFNEAPNNTYFYIYLLTYQVTLNADGSRTYGAGLYTYWRASQIFGPSYNPNTASGIRTVLSNSWNYQSGTNTCTITSQSVSGNDVYITIRNDAGYDIKIHNNSNGGKYNSPFLFRYVFSSTGAYGNATHSWTSYTQRYERFTKYFVGYDQDFSQNAGTLYRYDLQNTGTATPISHASGLTLGSTMISAVKTAVDGYLTDSNNLYNFYTEAIDSTSFKLKNKVFPSARGYRFNAGVYGAYDTNFAYSQTYMGDPAKCFPALDSYGLSDGNVFPAARALGNSKIGNYRNDQSEVVQIRSNAEAVY